MSPGDGERRPADEPSGAVNPGEKFKLILASWPDIPGLDARQSHEFEHWLRGTYELNPPRWTDDDAAVIGAVSRELGYAAAEEEMAAHWRNAVRDAQHVLAQPTRAELVELRELDHQPCPRRCRSCSRCQHSLAYWSRGGRDYLGVAAEAALAAGAS